MEKGKMGLDRRSFSPPLGSLKAEMRLGDQTGNFREICYLEPGARLFFRMVYLHYVRLTVHYDDHLEVCQTAVVYLPTYLASEPQVSLEPTLYL